MIVDAESDAGQAYSDAVARLLGEDVPLRFIDEKVHWLKRMFGMKEKVRYENTKSA